MKAFRMHGVKDARFDDVPECTPEPGELVLQPVVSGLCSTDVHILFDGALVSELPLTLGHEVVGRVVESRPGEEWAGYTQSPEPVAVGDLVCVEPLFPCGKCPYCLRGHQNLCELFDHLGITRDGNWADFVTAPARRTLKLTDGLDPMDAILVEPLACGLNFIDKAGPAPGKNLLILGAGPAGLLTVQAAKASGAIVTVSEPNANRRALASELGADFTVDPASEDLGQAVADVTSGIGADAIIEITGSSQAITQAIDIARRGSTVVLAGVCGQQYTGIDTNQVMLKEMTIRGAVASLWHFKRAMEMIAKGIVNVRPLVSKVAPIAQVRTLLDIAHDDRDICKILISH